MLKLALGIITAALLMSGCTAIQNTVGGGGSSGGNTGGGDNGSGGGGSGGSSGAPIASFTRGNFSFNLYSCKRYSDNAANVICTFDATNTSSSDSNLEVDARGDGYTRAILEDGREFGSLGFKCSTCQNWSQSRTNWGAYRSQIIYKDMAFRFNIPAGTTKIKYLDLYLYSSNRLRDIPITP